MLNLNDPTAPPAPVALAAAVLLLRPLTGPSPHGDTFEVFMVRRSSRLAFMPEALVFVGGRVDDADADPSLAGRLGGLEPLPGLSDQEARAVRVAAARECLEEAGVLVGAHNLDPLLLAAARAGLNGGTLTFAQAVDPLNVEPDLGGLRLVDHWVTPPIEKRRYDTRFFAVRAPADQGASFAPGENTAGAWYGPRQALAAYAVESIGLAPPTLRQLYQMAAVPSITRFLEGPVDPVQPICPQAKPGTDGTLHLLLPGDVDFDPPGARRNRVVLKNGRCVSEGHPEPA
jgi:8-oxo-dGTP pyrophosphatase MutT (NUDIX family)